MITQGKVSKALLFDFLGKFGLKSYTDRRSPCVFFGCYKGRGDVLKITNHKSLAVVCWRGTDILGMTPEDIRALKKPNIFHIAISDNIAHDLSKYGFKYNSIPVTATKLRFNPAPLGDSVYTYMDKRRPIDYGWPIIKKLKERYEIIVATGGYSNMEDIYRRCFIGLRLTRHDGLPNTVIEMGLMGRKCVYNGLLPNAIGWENTKDVISAIETERTKIGMIPFDVARKVFDYLNIGEQWLNEKTYV